MSKYYICRYVVSSKRQLQLLHRVQQLLRRTLLRLQQVHHRHLRSLNQYQNLLGRHLLQMQILPTKRHRQSSLLLLNKRHHLFRIHFFLIRPLLKVRQVLHPSFKVHRFQLSRCLHPQLFRQQHRSRLLFHCHRHLHPYLLHQLRHHLHL